MRLGGSNVNFGTSGKGSWGHGGGGDYGSGGLHSSTYFGGDIVSRMLLTNYTFRSRPVVNSSNPIVVEVMLTVIQLITLHEKQQEMATKVWFDQYWTDEFLIWEPEELNNISWMTFRSNEIWVPDIAIDNSIKYEREDMDIKVSYTGDVWWSMPAVVRTSCNIDTKKFPFDTQTCTITLGSWYHAPSELDLVVFENRTEMKTQYFMHNAQWDVVSSAIEILNEYHADYDMTFRTIHFTMSFKRKSLYFLLILIVPFIMISTVSLSNFILPCESGEKISLGITVLLSLFVNLLNLVDLLPESSDSFPILGSYYLISMGLVASSVVMTVIVLNIHHQPIKSRRLSSILREGKSFLFLARLLCVGRPVKTPRKFAKLSAHAYQMTPSFMNGSVADAKNCYGGHGHGNNKNICISPQKQTVDGMDTVVNRIHSGRPTKPHAHVIAKEPPHRYSTYFNIHEAADQCYMNSKKGSSDKVSPQQNETFSSRHPMKLPNSNLSSDVSPEVTEMFKCLHLLQDIKDKLTREQTKDLEKEYQKFIKEEWRYLARVVDRLLGLLYVLLFVALIVAFS